MTRAFCSLVLHYSVARLSWKTIKSLRRPRSQSSSSTSSARTNDARDDDDDDDVSPGEYEILQGWTVLAFHHLYVSCMIEYVVRCFVPFYYHLKLLALVATFVVPSRHEFGGMSPAVAYWFDYLVVPGVQWAHDLVGNDPRGWARLKLATTPFVFVDCFVFPGLLTSEEGKIRARERLLLLPPQPPGRQMRREDDDHAGDAVAAVGVVPPPIAFPDKLPRRGGRSSSDDDPMPPMTTTPPRTGSTPPDEDTPAGENRIPAVRRTTTMTPNGDHSSSSSSSPADIFSSRERFDAILTPLARRRLASTASMLKRFSPEYRVGGGIGGSPSIEKSPLGRRGGILRYDGMVIGDDGDGDDVSRADVIGRRIEGSPEGTRPSSISRRADGGGRRRERLSLGDRFRELVTGDAGVRVRDHLFDLDLPSTPEKRRKGSGGSRGGDGGVGRGGGGRGSGKGGPDGREWDDARHVTTRRSSRIARKKVF